MLPDENSLKTRYEFSKVRYLSKKHKTRSFEDTFTLSFTKPQNYTGPSKFGIIVSKKFHKSAVKRNKAKRIFREIIRTKFDRIKDGYWIVIYPKISCLDKSYEEIDTVFNKTLQKNNITS